MLRGHDEHAPACAIAADFTHPAMTKVSAMAHPRRFSLALSAALAALCMLAVPQVRAQQHNPHDAPLQERMSYAEFTRLGLDKLSPAQLKALNAWLHTHGERGPSVEAMESARAAQPQKAGTGPDEIHTHIVGAFNGWNSGSVFTLANGQRWQVAGDSQLMIHSMHNPKVTLRKSFFGSWLMDVDGVDQEVHITPAH